VSGRTFVSLVVAGLAALGAWTWQEYLHEDRPPAQEPSPQVLGVYMRNAVVISPGEDGRPRYRLEAGFMNQALGSERVELSDILIEYSHETPRPWRLTADAGEVRLDWRQVLLAGNVVAIAPAAAGEVATTLLTEEMTVDAEQNEVRAPGQVIMVRGEERLAAVGMSANLMAETVRLESEVHGLFQPLGP
jgi:LPS export ABC transporter protein LptC